MRWRNVSITAGQAVPNNVDQRLAINGDGEGLTHLADVEKLVQPLVLGACLVWCGSAQHKHKISKLVTEPPNKSLPTNRCP